MQGQNGLQPFSGGDILFHMKPHYPEKAKVFYLEADSYDRVIAVSDLHGHKKEFNGLIKHLNLWAEGSRDILIIAGDILEKGPDILGLLRQVMELCGEGKAVLCAGNNDVIFDRWQEGCFSDEEVLTYTQKTEFSILTELARELGASCNTLEDVQALRPRIFEHFSREIKFLHGLPHIIDSPFAVFVHGGIRPGTPLEEQDAEECISVIEFAAQKGPYEKPVVVGHWPASNYCDGQIVVSPYHNREANIIAIDGGMGLKTWQQINYIIFNKDGSSEEGYYDELPKIRALDPQGEAEDPFTLIFSHTMLEVRRGPEKGMCLCYVPYLDRELNIKEDQIYEYKGKTYCYDVTTYTVPCEAGEILSFCETQDEGVLVKKEGRVGMYYGRWEFIDQRQKGE